MRNIKVCTNLKKRLVYVYEFSDNYAYVGITCNERKRHLDHLNGISPVHKHIDTYHIQPIKKILSDGYVEVEEAQILENFWLETYKSNNWHILNKMKAGSLGSNILKWNKENCHEVALKCTTRKEFSIKYGPAYISSRKNKWLDEICSHMEYVRMPKDYWTYEKCKEAAIHCDTRFEFSHKYSHAYLTSSRNNWLDEFIPIRKK